MSSLFGALAPPTDAQSSSCFVPPANAESLFVAWASSRPVNAHPDTVVLAVRFGAVPVQVVGAKLFQSKLIGAAGARLPSSPSKPAAFETGPADAGPDPAYRSPSMAKHSADSAAMMRLRLLIRRWVGLWFVVGWRFCSMSAPSYG